MDGVNTGAYLMQLMNQGSKAAAGGDLDAQILAALKQPAPSTGGALQMDSPQANAQAAATAAAKPQTLQVGLGPWMRHDTGIPVPPWLNNGIVGAGAKLHQDLASLGLMHPSPLTQAVENQALSTTAGKIGGAIGETAALAPIGAGVGAGLGKLGVAGAGLASNPFTLGAAQGAVQGALTANSGSRLGGALAGAAVGTALPGVGSAVGKVARGLARTPEAQALIARGAQLTPGQLNPDGLWNRIEESLTSLPFVGGKIAGARAAALPAVTRAMVQDAMAPGATLSAHPADFNAMVGEVKDSLDNAYQSAVHGYPVAPKTMRVQGADIPLSKSFDSVAAKPRIGLDATQRSSMGQQLQDQLKETIAVAKRSGGMMSDHLQALRSQLRTAARDATEPAVRDFWSDAGNRVTQAMESQLPPDASAALRQIDRQYGKFATLRQLAVSAKDKEPTLNQLSTAIKQTTPANVYATGGGWNRDLTKAATDVLGAHVPMTGLTGAGTVAPIMRGVEGGLGLLGAGTAMEHPLGMMGALGGLGGLWGAYTKRGLRTLTGQTGAQQAMQRALGHLSPNALDAARRYFASGSVAGLMSAQAPRGLLAGP